jgi:hypothetical protein
MVQCSMLRPKQEGGSFRWGLDGSWLSCLDRCCPAAEEFCRVSWPSNWAWLPVCGSTFRTHNTSALLVNVTS